MDRINRENRDKNTQKKRTERRTALQTTSSDCQPLHTFSSRDMQTRIIIGERTSKRCRVIKEKIPSNLTVARYLFPVVSCGHFTPYQSHKYALREKGMEQVVCACTFASDFLLFPLLSSELGTRISPAYICAERSKNDN